MTRILVTGASGQLGKALKRKLSGENLVFAERYALDLDNINELRAKLNQYNFGILINAGAYTAVDMAEDNVQDAKRINALAPEIMADVCKSKSALLVHISTDYVFGDKPPRPILEDTEPNPVSVYGSTKLEGEMGIRISGAQHIIIRTSWLYGPDGHNFLKTMLALASSGKHPSVVFDQVGTPTFVDHLANAIEVICRCFVDSPRQFPSGTYHFSNEGVASWYDFAHAIFELMGMDVNLVPVRSDAFPAKAIRPAYSVLDKQKIKDTFDLTIPHWREGLKECLALLKSPQ